MERIVNQSQGAVEWDADGLHFTELIKQEYGDNNCRFSGGSVEGHPIDTVYLSWAKDGDEGGMLLLTPDEIAAVGWVCNGVAWSHLLDQRIENEANGIAF